MSGINSDITASLADLQQRWYATRTQPKAEQLAAKQLQARFGLETFAPRLSYWKNTARGRVRWHEALFPGYCLVRFDWAEQWRMVNSAAGVSGVVRFGELQEPPYLGEAEVAELQERCGQEQVVEVAEEFEAGDEVELVAGAMRGLQVVVSQYLPAKQRLAVLMEMLGQTREVEVSLEQVGSRRRTPAVLAAFRSG